MPFIIILYIQISISDTILKFITMRHYDDSLWFGLSISSTTMKILEFLSKVTHIYYEYKSPLPESLSLLLDGT